MKLPFFLVLICLAVVVLSSPVADPHNPYRPNRPKPYKPFKPHRPKPYKPYKPHRPQPYRPNRPQHHGGLTIGLGPISLTLGGHRPTQFGGIGGQHFGGGGHGYHNPYGGNPYYG